MKIISTSATLVVCVCLTGLFCGCRAPRPGDNASEGATVVPYPNSSLTASPEAGMAGEPFAGVPVRGRFPAVYFAYDSSTVADAERSKAEEAASFLRNNAGKVLVIEGHCDERGSNEYNLALGERRALAIRAYLVGLGVEADRIQTKSFGEEQPVAMGHNEESWRLNRRGEFVIIQ